MKKSGIKSGLLVFISVLLLISMSGIVSAFVRINEIMYDPSAEQGGDTNVEWVELYNNGTTTINLADWTIDGNNFEDYNITVGEYLIVVDKVNGTNSFEEWWGNNDTIWNSTDGNYNVIDGSLSLDDDEDTFNITNGTYSHVIHYLDDWGGDSNNKTLIFYKGNWTESALENGTPGSNNDQFAPDFNKWAVPSKNNSIISGLVNITVNITDVTNVSSALINFNNTNYTMSQNNDVWYYLWNTSKNLDGEYNITIFFNDTVGLSNTDTLFYATVDNTKPEISNPTANANTRNFVSKNSAFNASVTATDSNLLNVTCTLEGLTVGNSSKVGDVHSCSLTAPSTENDFTITFAAIDKAGNRNTTNVSFTTKYSTTANLTTQDITVNSLNQSNKIVEVTATFNNKGSSTIYSPNIILSGFESNFAVPTTTGNKTCAANLTAGQSCSSTFNITIFGGTAAGAYTILWKANWTDNSFASNKLIESAPSVATISSNPRITVTENMTATIGHNASQTLNILLNSTGNADLQNVNIAFTPSTLQSSWVTITPSTFSSITAGLNKSFNVTVAIPKYTSLGNYTGTLTISATSAESKSILLKIEVPEDSSWTSYPSSITIFKKTNSAGLLGAIYINNTGNIGHRFDFSAAGNLREDIWNYSNPTSQYVEAGRTELVNFSYKKALDISNTYTATLSITSFNKSTVNYTSLTLTRDDNNPTLNITSPLNNSFVKGNIGFNVTATDLNLSTIKFYIGDTEVFNDINLTKTFNWNTTNGNYPDEVYTLIAIAYDSAGNYNSSTISVTVNNTDSNPVLRANIPNITLNEGGTITFNLSNYFKSIDGDSLSYLSTTPDNVIVTINNTNTTATLAAKEDFFGIRYIVFYANDTSGNLTASNNVTINVANVNDAPTTPTLLSPADTASVFSAAGSVTLNWTGSTDPDGDAITYYLLYGISASVNLTANTPNTYLTLSNLNNATTYYWKVYAADGTANSLNSSMFSFTVTRDGAPVISNYTPSSLTPSVAENSILEFNVTASDPDGGLLNHTWYLDGILNKTDGNKFNYTPNFEAAGTHTVKVDITDNNSNSVSNTWTVTVTNTNREPVLDTRSIPSVNEDSAIEFNLTATDPDGDSLTFTSNISSILFTNAANNSMAAVSWNPTNEYVGDNSILFTVNDSSKNASQAITITVTNTNDAPTITSFSPAGDKTIAEGAGSQRFDVTFSDVDVSDDATAYWLANTTGITSIVASNSSNITVTGLNKGIYNITVKVNDTSGAATRKEWALTVTTGMISDELTSAITGLNQSQRENVTNVMVNQSNYGGINFGNETMNFSKVANLEDAVNISKGLISVDTANYPELNKPASIVMKGLDYTKAPLIYNDSGFKNTNGNACPEDVCTNITYDAANGILRFNVPHFSTYYTQTNTTNGAPIITSDPVLKATENARYTYDVDATDPDGNTLTYSLVESKFPDGMSINNETGVISWTPTEAQLGIHNVTVSVTDGSLPETQSFNITVGKGPKLIISGLDVKVGSKTSKSVQNNTKISKKAAPGSEVEFKIEIENIFTDDENLKIKDIDVEIIIEGIDDGDDLEENADEFDLRQGKSEDIKINFEVPLEVEEGIFDVIINVQGEDTNRTIHEITWGLSLEVEKESHEIKIIRSALTPSTVACQRQVSLNTEIINTGTNDEDDVTLEITSMDLGISSLTTDIELDEGTDDNRLTKLVRGAIPEDVLPGAYPITINTYYDGKLSETKTVDLTVEECELTKEIKKEVKEAKPKVEVIMPPVTMEKKPSAEVISSAKTDEYNTLLAILIVLFLGTAVFVIGAGYIVLKK